VGLVNPIDRGGDGSGDRMDRFVPGS